VNDVHKASDLESGGSIGAGVWVLGPRDPAAREGEGVLGEKHKTERRGLGFREQDAGEFGFG